MPKDKKLKQCFIHTTYFNFKLEYKYFCQDSLIAVMHNAIEMGTDQRPSKSSEMENGKF